MQTESNQKPLLGADNNALVALLAINLVTYVLLGLLKVIYYLESLPLDQFYTQIFQPFIMNAAWMQHPWSLFTYNWVHEGFWVLFANMSWLSLFAYQLQLKGANKHLFPIYFYTGIIGGLAFYIMGSNQALLGAGVSITGIVIAGMALIPNHKLLTNIGNGFSLWILGIVYLLLQGYLLVDAPIATTIAIVIGGLFGFVYVMFLKKGYDLGKWMHQLLHLLNNSLAPKN
jgi:membrane associated rhomboid family serine protease